MIRRVPRLLVVLLLVALVPLAGMPWPHADALAEHACGTACCCIPPEPDGVGDVDGPDREASYRGGADRGGPDRGAPAGSEARPSLVDACSCGRAPADGTTLAHGAPPKLLADAVAFALDGEDGRPGVAIPHAPASHGSAPEPPPPRPLA